MGIGSYYEKVGLRAVCLFHSCENVKKPILSGKPAILPIDGGIEPRHAAKLRRHS